jgi:hypothetical protein
VFLPYLVWPRVLAEFGEEAVVLLMDNCSAHVTDDVIRSLIEARVHVITFTPRITQILQILDLTLFGFLKRRPRYERPFEKEHAMVKLIMKVYHDFKQTMVPPSV